MTEAQLQQGLAQPNELFSLQRAFAELQAELTRSREAADKVIAQKDREIATLNMNVKHHRDIAEKLYRERDLLRALIQPIAAVLDLVVE